MKYLTPEEFAQRHHKVCAGCRTSKPLAEFRVLWHTNKHTGRGKRVHFGWADRCLGCEEAKGAA